MSYYFRDQLSIKTNKILANLFAELILLSQQIQSFRQILSSVPYYDCVQLFRALDRGEKGFLRLNDFLHLIGQSHKKVVTYIFSWFDQAKLGEVSRLQFISFLMPRRNDQLRQVTARRIQEPVTDENFSTTINQQLKIFTQLLNQMISHQLKIIEQRKILLKQQDYSLKGVLHSLDANCHDFVTAVDFLKFLQNYAIKASKEQIQDFLEIVDSRLTGKINLDQLKWVIEGLQTKQKDYLKKIKSSLKGKSSRKVNTKDQVLLVTEKSFVRTPLKSTKNYYEKKQLFKSRNQQKSQSNAIYASQLKQSRKEKDKAYESKKKQNSRVQQEIEIDQNKKIMEKEYFTSAAELKFDSILQRYREAEKQALQKDVQLIRAQLQLKDKLRDEFEQRSQQRIRLLTQMNTIESQRRYIQNFPVYYPERSSLYGFTEPKIRSRAISYDYDLGLQYKHPHTSKYDKKINTIVENFYRRNNGGLSSDSIRKYGTISGTFDYDRQRSQSTTFNRPSYGQNSSYSKNYRDEEMHKVDKVRPFDHQPASLKKQINKKLRDQPFNINISHKKYDPLMHQLRQKPLQQSIRRLKETTQVKEENKNQTKTLSPKMLQNISIISKETPSINVSAAKPSPKIEKDFVLTKTQQKVRFAETPSSAYQSVVNSSVNQKRGIQTTETRYPGTQLKPYGSPLNYVRRQL